jgi:hypothetical protein
MLFYMREYRFCPKSYYHSPTPLSPQWWGGVTFELKLSLGGPLSKLCVTLPFSINFRCQIENQVSDYRFLGASSLKEYFVFS